MGDPNASIPTPQPVLYRPMFGALGGARARHLRDVRVAGGARGRRAASSWACASGSVAVRDTRADRASATWSTTTPLPDIEVDPETYEVRADGELLTCEPADDAAAGPALLPVLRATTTMTDAELHRRSCRDRRARRRSTGDADPRLRAIAGAAGCARASTTGARRRCCCRAGRCCATAIACAPRRRAWSTVRAAERRCRSCAPRTRSLLARAAYHLGNRHVPVQVGAGLAAPTSTTTSSTTWSRSWAWRSTTRVAPFEPEAGGYRHGARAKRHDTSTDTAHHDMSTEHATRVPSSAGGVALTRLLQLVSPALPIGAFAYSQGLEQAVARAG